MGFGLVITTGDDKNTLPENVLQWLVEVRIEMELSKPTRYALRFEDDLCEGQPAVEGRPELSENTKLGIFVRHKDSLECLVYGPVTDVKSSSVLGGAGSWVEIHGEDRRIEMNRLGVQGAYLGKASETVKKIVGVYGFKEDIQGTLIEYDERNKLTQRATDLAFLEDIARRNNMELWVTYETQQSRDRIQLTETVKLRTSPHRAQQDDAPQVPRLVPDENRHLKVNPPAGECPTVNRFEAKIDYEKPTASKGFAMTEQEAQTIVEQIVNADHHPPVDPDKILKIEGLKRETLAPPAATPEEAFLKKEALVYEQSWFVEADCSTTLELANFVVRPHQIVDVSHAGDRLSGAYQVMTATHVVTATDHFMDFVMRAN